MVGPLGGSAAVPPSNCKFFPIRIFGIGPPTPAHLITTAASLRLGNFLRHHIHRRFLLAPSSSFKYASYLGRVPYSMDVWHERASQLTGFNILQWSCNAISTAFLSSYFFEENENKNNSSDIRKAYSRTSRRGFFSWRKWTNIILAANVLMYIAQTATQGKLIFWGAKINSLIDKGQLWRLVTSSFLHANIGHLLVNCYSLNSIGPAVEIVSGPRRFLAVYITSSFASSIMSYCLCKAPAVGASGAIFGLVGSFAVFKLRHKGIIEGSGRDLQHIMHVIVLNMVLGVLSKGIDNWGHLGGLIGGAATSWLLGPAWELKSTVDGYKLYVDRPPIFAVTKSTRTKE